LLGRETAENAFNKAFQAQEARDLAQQQQIDRWAEDPAIVARAQEIRALKAPAPPQSSRNPQNQAIWQLLSKPDPKTGQVYDTTQFTKRSGALAVLSKPSGSNMGGRTVSLNAATQHLQEVDDLINALEKAKITGNFQPANAVSVRWRRALGYPEITNYEIGADIASKEVVKAIVPNGGSAGERDSMEKSLSIDHSPRALHGATGTLRGFLLRQYNAGKDWAEENHVETEFQHIVGPNTENMLKGGEAASGGDGWGELKVH